MKHLHFSILLAVLMSTVEAKAEYVYGNYDAKIDGICYRFDGDEAYVTFYYNVNNVVSEQRKQNREFYKGDVVIPETVQYDGNVYTVTGIGTNAFYGCIYMTSITIPKTVTKISTYGPFDDCRGLQEVHISDIAAWCNLDFFTGYGQTNPLSYAHHLFLNGEEVKDLVIPEGVTRIGTRAFSGCYGLSSVKIPNTVTNIGGRAFENCVGLTSVDIPNSVNELEIWAININHENHENALTFAGCSNLTSINVEEGNTVYDSRDNCNAIIETATNTLIIGCQGTIIPNTVTEIASEAFFNCSSLSSMSIPNSVTSIGVRAFSGCSGLVTLTIPNSVISIGRNAFDYCSGLQEVHISDIAAWCKIFFASGSYDYEATNPLKYAHHLFLNGEEVKDLVIPEGVTTINDFAFENCTELTSVSVSNTVTNIGCAFDGCANLKRINMPASLKTISSWIFYSCTNLEKIIIDDIAAWCGVEIEGIWEGESGCNSIQYDSPLADAPHLYTADNQEITHLIIPEGVERINEASFRGCKGIKTITLPNSIRSMGADVFYGTGWWEDQPEDELVYLGNVFIGNKNEEYSPNEPVIKELLIKEGTTVIADYDAYCGVRWRELESLYIPNSVITIGDIAFNDCYRLTSLTIGNSVTSIGEYAFFGCKGLTSVTIPNSVTEIGDCAFGGCTGLTSITIGKNVRKIGSSAFYNEADYEGKGKLKEVISLIEEPFDIGWYDEWNCFYSAFDEAIYGSTTLYVPVGTKEKYEATSGWKEFTNIVERGISPVEDNDDVNYGGGGDVNSNTDLDGNVVGNIYYNISDDNGEYSSAEGCIVVRKPTGDDVVSGICDDDLFSDELKDTFTGIIFMVQPGSGVITVNAETTGGMTLKVKVGDNPPTEIELEDKIKARFPYSVDKASYVFIYAGGGGAGAKAAGTTRASSEDVLKIYGIEWTSGTDGISTVSPEADVPFDVYTLTGNKVRSQVTPLKGLPRGVYVVNGRKIVVE